MAPTRWSIINPIWAILALWAVVQRDKPAHAAVSIARQFDDRADHAHDVWVTLSKRIAQLEVAGRWSDHAELATLRQRRTQAERDEKCLREEARLLRYASQ